MTASGLLFIAATSFDNKIRAFDKLSGKLLWEAHLPAAGNATPSVYEINGREYVVIVCGGGKNEAPSAAVSWHSRCPNGEGAFFGEFNVGRKALSPALSLPSRDSSRLFMGVG